MTEEQIERLIDMWHEDPNLGMPLHEWLGWSEVEYADYVGNGVIPRGR